MCSLTAAGLSAQTLTNDNVSPLDGSAFTQAGATYIAPGASGANVTWDFSALDQLSVVSFDYMSPASTPQGSSFPGANIASVTEGNTSYFNTSAAGYDLHGIYADGSDALIVYQDPERVLSYPCSYGTTWTDALLSNFELSGYQFERSGTVSGNADGYGTLIMPYGTVTNVLRVVTVEDYSDVTDLYTTDYLFTTHNYYKPGIRQPLLTITNAEVTILGSTNTSLGAGWTTNAAIGLEEVLRNDIGVDVMPNPASDMATVVYSGTGEAMTLAVVDAVGRTVLEQAVGRLAPGIQRTDLDVSGLPAGTYTMRALAADGQHGMRRFVVN